MASTPGHPFWLFLAGVIERQAHRSVGQRIQQLIKPLPAELATGPIVLKQVSHMPLSFFLCLFLLNTQSSMVMIKFHFYVYLIFFKGI